MTDREELALFIARARHRGGGGDGRTRALTGDYVIADALIGSKHITPTPDADVVRVRDAMEDALATACTEDDPDTCDCPSTVTLDLLARAALAAGAGQGQASESEREALVSLLNDHTPDLDQTAVYMGSCFCGWKEAKQDRREHDNLEHEAHVADMLMAAGFRRQPEPRVVRTVEELRTLASEQAGRHYPEHGPLEPDEYAHDVFMSGAEFILRSLTAPGEAIMPASVDASIVCEEMGHGRSSRACSVCVAALRAAGISVVGES